MDERFLAKRPWKVGPSNEVWSDSVSILDAEGATVCELTRGYESNEHGEGCPSWANARLIVIAVNSYKDA